MNDRDFKQLENLHIELSHAKDRVRKAAKKHFLCELDYREKLEELIGHACYVWAEQKRGNQ